MSHDKALAETYPALFGPLDWGVVHVAGFTHTTAIPDRSLIQSVNVVPFVGDRCIVVEVDNGSLTLPGGTREAGEWLLETAGRELMEEVGAEILGARPLGYWTCHSRRTEPWRAHLPHPNYLRLVIVADVRLVGSPTNPQDGEQISRVDLMALSDTVARFRRAGQPELADLYALAARVRKRTHLDQESQVAFDEAMSAR